MSDRSIWEVLQLHCTIDTDLIKKAYADLVKEAHPEEHPEAFIELNQAYKKALAFAKKQKRCQLRSEAHPIADKGHTPLQQANQNEEARTAFAKADPPPSCASSMQEEPSKHIPTQPYANHKHTGSKQQEDASGDQTTSLIIPHKDENEPLHESSLYQFDQPLEEAKKRRKNLQRAQMDAVIQELTKLIKQKAAYQSWNQVLSSQKFIQVATAPEFLHRLQVLIASHRSLPLQGILQITQVYQTLSQEDESKELIASILTEMDRQYTADESKRINRNRRISIFLIIASWGLAISFALMLSNLYPLLAALLLTTILLQCFPFKKNKKRKSRYRTSAYFILIASLVITMMINYGAHVHDDLKGYAKEQFGDHVTYQKEEKQRSETDHIKYYQFYDEAYQFSFHIKEIKDGDTITYENNYVGSFLNAKRASKLIQKKTDSRIQVLPYETIDAFYILIQKQDPSVSAKELYDFIQMIQRSPVAMQCDEILFYANPEDDDQHWTTEVKSYAELKDLSIQQIQDWLMYAEAVYKLDFTFETPDFNDPFVQQYFSEHPPLELTIHNQTQRFDDVVVEHGELSMGSFYRLAKQLPLNVEQLSKKQLIWYKGGTTEMLGLGSTRPYISLVTLKGYLTRQTIDAQIGVPH